MFVNAPAYLLIAVSRHDFQIANARFPQRFLFDRIARGRCTLEVPFTLIFDREHWPAALIDN